jgi:hypothetical protein
MSIRSYLSAANPSGHGFSHAEANGKSATTTSAFLVVILYLSA